MSRTVVVDHLGNKYQSIEAMCRSYNISSVTLKARIKQGWDLESALTIPVSKQFGRRKAVDPYGNEFNTIRDLCRHYDIDEQTVRQRLDRGMSLEDALKVTDKQKAKRQNVMDHLGNEFSSLEMMLNIYNTDKSTYTDRMTEHWSLEKALTTRTAKPGKMIAVDHKNKRYYSTYEMCKEYNVNLSTFLYRRKHGWTLKGALTTPDGKDGAVDHLGNRYASAEAMLKAYNINSSTFRERISKGMGLKDALTTPVNPPVKDHLGKEYTTILDMCAAYNIKYITFRERMKNGKSLEEALTERISDMGCAKEVTDHLGNKFGSIAALCRAYNIPVINYTHMRKRGLSIEEILTRLPGTRASVTRVRDHTGKVFKSTTEMCNYWGMDVLLVINRLQTKFPNIAVLTDKNSVYFKDHTGKTYRTFKDMCKAWNLSEDTVKNRLVTLTWSLKKALTEKE